MVSDYRVIRPQGSPHIPQTPSYCYFTERVHSSVSGSPVRPEELGLNQPQPFHGYHHQQIPHPYLHPHPHPYPYPYPYHLPLYAHDMHAAIKREIEKENIREEIIMMEIMRRRELEAEVRRELMMERELALRRGSHEVSFSTPSVTEVNSPTRPLEERIVPSLMDRERLNGMSESGGFEPLPFHRGSSDIRNSEAIPITNVPKGLEPLPFQRGIADVRNSEVIPVTEVPKGLKPLPFQRASADGRNSDVTLVTEVPKEKERSILGAKPNENTYGTKRGASKVDASESPSGYKPRKKAKEEWSCALCKVSSYSERVLNEHLQGKKHKTKEAALKVGKQFSIGLLSKKAATVGPGTGNSEKVSLDKSNNEADKLKKKEEPVVGNKKKMFEFWCELCQVGCPSENVLNNHRQGKKHMRRLRMCSKNRGDGKLAEDGGLVNENIVLSGGGRVAGMP
ncbi:hypothetical protein ACS0TY_024353 [Phlomoides rotata]